MLTYLFYLFTAMFASWIFTFIASLVEMVFMFVTGLYSIDTASKIQRRPKTFFSVLILKSSFLGLLNSYMILYVTIGFFLNYDINYWLYVITSVVWSLFILQYSGFNPWIYFFTSTVALVFLWLGFGLIAPIIIGLVSIVVGFAYHFGRINMYLEEYYLGD